MYRWLAWASQYFCILNYMLSGWRLLAWPGSVYLLSNIDQIIPHVSAGRTNVSFQSTKI